MSLTKAAFMLALSMSVVEAAAIAPKKGNNKTHDHSSITPHLEDAHHDLIKDVSAVENHHQIDTKEVAASKPAFATGLHNFIDDHHTEEKIDESGHHVRKEFHKGDGWESVQIQSDHPLEHGEIGNVIGQMMQHAMAEVDHMQKNMRKGGMQQRGNSRAHTMPIFIPHNVVQLADEDDHEHHEDPLEIIRHLEQTRRRPTAIPFFGGPHIIHVPHDFIEPNHHPHAVDPHQTGAEVDHHDNKDEHIAAAPHKAAPHKAAHKAAPYKAAHKAGHGKQKHHEVEADSHRNYHMLVAIFASLAVITALGLYIWQTYVVGNAQNISNTLSGQQKGYQAGGISKDNSRQSEIRMTAFNKQK